MQEKKLSLGGLSISLRPNEEIELRNSDYVLRNNGPVTCRVQIYSKKRRDEINAELEARFTAEALAQSK